MTASLLPDTPRSRDRRWRRCQEIIEQHQRIRPADDDWVRAGVHFLRGRGRCLGDDRRLARLARRWPDLLSAEEIYHGAVPPLRTLLLEAHLRAGTPFETVDRLTGFPVPVVRYYGQLFFAVPDQPPQSHPLDWTRLLASGFGAFVLDAALERLRPRFVGEGSRLNPAAAEHACTALWVKVALTITARARSGPIPCALATRVRAIAHRPERNLADRSYADDCAAECAALQEVLDRWTAARALAPATPSLGC